MPWTASGRLDGEMLTGAVTIFRPRLADAVCCGLLESLTETAKLKGPPALVVPLITPVIGLNVNDRGKPLTLHV
jgi:hypothetical protein